MNKLARLKSMSGRERLWLLQAWVLLPVIKLLLRSMGFVRTQRLLMRISGKPAGADVVAIQAQACAIEISRLVGSASRYSLLVANCLPQALVLWWLLRRTGIPSELRIGVSKQHGSFEAHAWVEVFGAALDNQADAEQRFAPFDASILPPEVRLP